MDHSARGSLDRSLLTTIVPAVPAPRRTSLLIACALAEGVRLGLVAVRTPGRRRRPTPDGRWDLRPNNRDLGHTAGGDFWPRDPGSPGEPLHDGPVQPWGGPGDRHDRAPRRRRGPRDKARGEQTVVAGHPPPRLLVRGRVVERGDRGPRLGEAHPQPLAGERVDVPGGVTDQPDAPRGAGGGALPERTGAQDAPDDRRTREVFAELGEGGESLLPPGPGGTQERDANEVGSHRCHVGLRRPGPVHLDEVGPRCDAVVAAQAEPPPPGLVVSHLEAGQPPHSRVQPVAREEPPCAHFGGLDAVRGGDDVADPGGHPLHAQLVRAGPERRVEGGPPHPSPGTGPEVVVDRVPAGPVADSAQRVAVRVDAEPRSGPVDKACGEGLMPGTIRALQRLGVDPDGHPLRGISYRARGHAVDHGFRAGAGRGVRRTALHAALRARADELGVERVAARVGDIVVTADNVEAAEVSARWLLACDGLHSTVRRLTGLEVTDDKAGRRRFGLRRHYGVAPWTDLVEVHWARSAEAYVTPVAPDLVGVALLGPARTGWEETLAALPELGEHLAGAPVVGSVLGAGPLRQRTTARTAGRGRHARRPCRVRAGLAAGDPRLPSAHLGARRLGDVTGPPRARPGGPAGSMAVRDGRGTARPLTIPPT